MGRHALAALDGQKAKFAIHLAEIHLRSLQQICHTYLEPLFWLSSLHRNQKAL